MEEFLSVLFSQVAVLQRQSSQPCFGSRFFKPAPAASGDGGGESCVLLLLALEVLWQEGSICLLDSGCAEQKQRCGGFRLKKEGLENVGISRARWLRRPFRISGLAASTSAENQA